MKEYTHPFADLLGIKVQQRGDNQSLLTLTVEAKHFNPQGVIHGGVIYSLADTGMGAALYPSLDEGEYCATIEIKITYFRPVSTGELVCKTTVVNRGKTVANMDADIFSGDVLVAKANGNFSIFTPSARKV